LLRRANLTGYAMFVGEFRYKKFSWHLGVF
jgi:hypothetical protein